MDLPSSSSRPSSQPSLTEHPRYTPRASRQRAAAKSASVHGALPSTTNGLNAPPMTASDAHVLSVSSFSDEMPSAEYSNVIVLPVSPAATEPCTAREKTFAPPHSAAKGTAGTVVSSVDTPRISPSQSAASQPPPARLPPSFTPTVIALASGYDPSPAVAQVEGSEPATRPPPQDDAEPRAVVCSARRRVG